jgi:hypothetical protein
MAMGNGYDTAFSAYVNLRQIDFMSASGAARNQLSGEYRSGKR